ncbi:hypothetical protein [Streptomyces subrutilus]|uniref:hypothetical protein n=1 Tax=Streptomyces subrutilus TaxID=36818 RepID=UPI003409D5BC
MRLTTRTLAALALGLAFGGTALIAAGTAHAHGVASAPRTAATAVAGVADDLTDELELDEVEGLDLINED